MIPLTLIAVSAIQTPAAPASPLLSASSFTVQESLGNARITVQVKRPNRVSVVLASNNNRNGRYVFDGKDGYEYHEWTKSYVKLNPLPDGRILTPLMDLGAVDVLLNGGTLPTPAPNTKRTTGHDSVNGKDAILTTDLGPESKGKDGKTYQSELKLWVDASTGLPLRRVEGVIADGQEHPFQDLTFDKFDLTTPVAIVWKAPEGSTEGEPNRFIKVGQPAPNFAAIGPDGKTVHLADLKGKVVVLDFWATWCVPCQRAMPHLQHVAEQVKGRSDVTILGLCVWDQQDAYKDWVKAKKGTYTFTTAFDPAGRGANSIASKLFGVDGIPTQYVIDKNGNVAAAYIAVEGTARPLETTLGKLGIPVK